MDLSEILYAHDKRINSYFVKDLDHITYHQEKQVTIYKIRADSKYVGILWTEKHSR